MGIVTDGRRLAGMVRHGFILWDRNARDRHWTGQTVPRKFVAPGAKLEGRHWARFTYRGKEYKLEYFDGCFHPFVVEIGKPVPGFV